MIYLDVDDLLHIAARVVGGVDVRDVGLLEAAAARPQATTSGGETYPSLRLKVAALLHSVATTQPLVDGNKRLALATTIAFLGVNGKRLTLSNDKSHNLIDSVANGSLRNVEEIAAAFRTGPRRPRPH